MFVTRDLPGPALDRLREVARVDVWPGELPPPYGELGARTVAAEGLISLLTDRIDAALIERAPKLRVISNYAVGYDNIDLAAAASRGIAVGNTPRVLTETTADLAFALLLAAARRITEGDRYVREGRWQTWGPATLLGHDVHGATLGIIGFGAIARAVARRADGFGMKVVYTARHEAGDTDATRLELDELLRQSDFVSLHVPLKDETRQMIGERELRRLKRTAVLVNTARGPIVDSLALARALEHGWIAGAALDVTDPEPLPAGHPLMRAPNLVLVPHIGSASHATRERMASMAVDNCIAGLRGEPLPHGVVSGEL